MLHDENHCPFDLWAPDRHTKVNNVAFSCYAKHSQETEDIIQTILEAAMNGSTDFSIQLDDDFSDEDIEYIKEEVYRRMR
jgi:hypothetical protein